MDLISTIMSSFVNSTTQSTKKKIQLYKCSVCKINSDDIWTDETQIISCCKYCWGNDPIIARVMNGKKLIHR